MDYTTLDELMKIQKKGEASQANKKLFTDEMIQMLREVGLTDEAIRYMRSGFGFSAAMPLAMYIKQSSGEDRSEIISKIGSSDLLKGGDKVAAFKMAVNLSAFSIIWLGEDQRLLVEMIKVLPNLSKNKEKQLLKDASKIYEKYFLSIVSDNAKYPSLDPETTGLKDYYLREYRNMLDAIMEKVSREYSSKVEAIYAWIGKKGNSGDENVSGTENQEKQPVTEENNKQIEEPEKKAEQVEKKVEPYSYNDLIGLLASIGDFTERIRATAEQLRLSERANYDAQVRMAELTKANQDLFNQIETLKRKNDLLTEELGQSREYNLSLNEQNKSLEKTVSEKDVQIGQLQEEITRLNSIISVYSADKQNSQSEQLNAIASKLKSEYKDFQDAANEEMTLDLGENFRFQLQSIFKILMKAGIDVERR